MAKRTKVYDQEGYAIEIWEEQVKDYTDKGFTTEKPKKKTTTKKKEVEDNG